MYGKTRANGHSNPFIKNPYSPTSIFCMVSLAIFSSTAVIILGKINPSKNGIVS